MRSTTSRSWRSRARAMAVGCVVGGVAGVVVGSATPREQGAVPELTDRQRRVLLGHAPLPPLPADPTNAFADDPAAAHFGQYLFFDTRFSSNGNISCATCHDPQHAFADGKPMGSGLQPLTRHTMSVLNTSWNRWFFWDGRIDTQWAQALQPIEDPREFGGNRIQVAHAIHADDDLRTAYESIFGPMPPMDDAGRFPPAGRPMTDDKSDPMHVAWAAMKPSDRVAVNTIFANVGKAIAAYERKLVRRDAPFDTFVDGVRTGDALRVAALSPAAQRGWKLFSGAANCRLCHFGATFSDGEFHSTGVPPRSGRSLRDAGRYNGVPLVREDPFNAAGSYSDARDGAAAEKVRSLRRTSETWGQFKTPTLRNVALTAPYMHQGQFETLEEVVRYYSTLEGAVLSSHHQEQLLVPLNLSDDQIADLVAFLESLTGAPLPPALATQPSRATPGKSN